MESLCEICYEKEAEYVCKICGRKVCRNHYKPESGLCSLCARTLCQICGQKLSIGYCQICGRLGCDTCLRQIDPARWVCIECLQKHGIKGVERLLRAPAQPASGPLKVLRKLLTL